LSEKSANHRLDDPGDDWSIQHRGMVSRGNSTHVLEVEINVGFGCNRILLSQVLLKCCREITPTVEPVFVIIKSVMGFRQFSLRGLTKVTSEWTLVCLAWNLKRLAVLRLQE
jgi:hypothetical protein